MAYEYKVSIVHYTSLEATNHKDDPPVLEYGMTQTITVEGMTCGHCEQTVEDALNEVAGVTDVSADREAEQVSIEGDADTDELVRAAEDAGYTSHA